MLFSTVALAQPASAAQDHTVQAGDTISGIALEHGLETSVILEANSLDVGTLIHPGQKIKLSGSAEISAATTEISPADTTAAPKPADKGTYTIGEGDTLSAIAAKHKVSLADLLTANDVDEASLIYPGTQLTIPGGAASTEPESDKTVPPTDLVPSTFLHYTYPEHVVSEANRNKQLLNSQPVPSNDEMKKIVSDTARSMDVDPSLALAVSYQESGFNPRAVSPANAIGAMQVIPSSGEWASDLVGRKLNLLDPHDNATAGVAILQSLVRTSDNLEDAVASYYQGQHSVRTKGMFSDTLDYVAAIKSHQKNYQ